VGAVIAFQPDWFLLCRCSAPEIQWTRMFWLVNAHLAAAGKRESSKFSPTLFTHLRDLHILRFEVFQRLHNVIAHEIKLVLVVLFRFVERRFELRHRENQPALTGIDGGKLKYIAKERPVSFWVPGVDDDMRAINQA